MQDKGAQFAIYTSILQVLQANPQNRVEITPILSLSHSSRLCLSKMAEEDVLVKCI
ncbi:hypothetical protein HYC85_029913 [Camellia sinensis]|uniref:Uncharacterized protein n=1 Tax=Camellia sinensis TaxID=4442 RepID=A0A7J7FZA3_CAMSI|nr:hypothetical protein HYC85_029913 [Camellia sinensis]